MTDEEHRAGEFATQLVTANIAYRTSDRDEEEDMELLAYSDVEREIRGEALEEEVISALCQFVGSFVLMNAELRGDSTPLEYWSNFALEARRER